MSADGSLRSLADTLFSNELLLNSREKDLLSHLLRSAGAGTPHARAVEETIARAVGETLIQRACGALGEDILRRLEGFPESGSALPQAERGIVHSMPPFPPSPSPGPPGPRGPAPPGPPGAERVRHFAVPAAAANPSAIESARCVVYDEFLSPAEMDGLLEYTLSHQAEFVISEIVSPDVENTVDFHSRRSRVLMKLGRHQETLLGRIHACLPGVLQKLGRPAIELASVEAQITASGEGDFFRWHTDNGHPAITTRELTFVYFFHREPKRFRGGELRIYDSRMENGSCVPTQNYRAIVPCQNQIVFFFSSLAHEITPVECPTGAFVDSRFTVNGWFHRTETPAENGSRDRRF